MSKAKAQRRHAARRAQQRLGIALGPQRMAELVRMIQAGEMELHSKQSNRVTRFLHTIDDERCMVIYDRKRKNIVTIWKVDEDGQYREDAW